jgi:serine protease Do
MAVNTRHHQVLGQWTFAGLLVKGARMPRYLPVTFAVAVLVASATDAISEHVYSVGELTLGGRYNSDVYRKYDCNPSEQFEGFTWCVLKKDEREKRGSFKASYSILHSQDGTAVYINRFQEPAYWEDNELKDDIAHYSRKAGEQPRIYRMPSRPGLPDAMIAVWGKVELEPLDNDSRQILAADKSVKRGILVDYLGNYTRSARENLPLYRITGGAGFVWIASNKNGRGILRILAISPSQFYPPEGPPRIANPAPLPEQQRTDQDGDFQYSNIGWWSVIYRKTGNLSGCVASSRFQDQTLAEMALVQSGPNQKEWAFFISSPRWNNWIARKSQHVMRFAADGRVWWRNFSASNQNVLFNYSISTDFIDSMADADVLRISTENYTTLTSLDMKDSRAAIQAVATCLRDHRYTPAPAPETETVMSGTGFFVTPNRLVTNNHVVKDCRSLIEIRFPGQPSHPAYIDAQDAANDLALLHTGLSSPLVASFGIRPRVGERVATYGFPYSDILSSSGNFTLGDISAPTGMRDDSRILQISVPIQPGNSGGPLFDMSGSVIGIVTAQLSAFAMIPSGSIPQNVNFAIRSTMITDFLSIRGVTPRLANSDTAVRDLSAADVADIAKEFTAQIYCKGVLKTSNENVDGPAAVGSTLH